MVLFYTKSVDPPGKSPDIKPFANAKKMLNFVHQNNLKATGIFFLQVSSRTFNEHLHNMPLPTSTKGLQLPISVCLFLSVT